MGYDKVGVANLALAKIGSKFISSFNDPLTEAKVINKVYDFVRDEFLCDHPWSFALTRVQLNQLAVTIPMTSDGVSVAYQVPADFLKAYMISDPSATYKLETINGVRVILSDTTGLQMVYVYRNDNPATYFGQALTAFATRLAAEIAFNLTNATKKSEALRKLYNEIELPKAQASDSQQGSPVQAIQDEWEQGRFLAGNGLIARPGYQTWTPVW